MTIEEINELEAFFNSVEVKNGVELFKGCIIVDVYLFLDSHFSTIYYNYHKNELWKPYLKRLLILKTKILCTENYV